MFALELIYALALLGLDAWALRALSRLNRDEAPALRAELAVVLAWAVAAWGLSCGVVLFASVMQAFLLARLWSWALFVHGPICWLGWALIARRRPRRWVPAALAGVLLIAVAVDAFLIEPTALETRRIQLQTSKPLKRPLRVALVADLQTDAIGAYERRVLRELAAAEPDLILFAGDYLQCWDRESYAREAAAFRAAWRDAGLNPRLGAFAVGGDCEHAGWEELFEGISLRPLVGTRDLGEVRLQGLTLGESARGAPPLPESAAYTIALGHRPGYALSPCDADLLLAGHTHGGQVQLPGIGPLVTLSRVPRDWASGRSPTPLPSGATLIVSRGLGMERGTAPRLRFGCRPELVIVEVQGR